MRSAVWAVALCMLVGCATKHYTPTVRYRLDTAIEAPAAAPIDGSLGVRALIAARPYRQAIVFQDAGLMVSVSDHEEWADLPSVMVTRILTDTLAATKRFKDVGDTINLASPDYMLTGELRRFDLVRTGSPWTAVCEARIELRKGMARELVWSDTLRSEKALERNETAALPTAMSAAVSDMVSHAVKGIIGRN